ncbi:MAG: proline--tRNA ligase [Spirochaetia bacterium]|nr:proline--tRNA ligase [Spirochaetia bacterium]
MRMSNQFSRTLREAPASADSIGYAFLLRCGFIEQLGAGVFTLLPLGLRSIRKIEHIIRDEMNAIGGQEMLMPVVNPADIWKETGRYYSIDKELSRFKDRVGRDMVLAMTHEECVSDVARYQIDSYKQLPQLVYQIQTKWRDDPRPRAGLIRVREFTMKDSYSFDRNQEGLELQYNRHYKAYFTIFNRCGLPTIAVGSDSGMMGGKVAHEYMYLSPIGEDTLITCSNCDYTANRQVATFVKEYYPEDEKKMEKVHTPNCKTIEELASFLDIPSHKTAKALFMMGTFVDEKSGEEENKLIVGVIRGDMEIEENKLQHASKANALRVAHVDEIQAMKMAPGYGSPIGADPSIIVVVDDSVAKSNNLVAGANVDEYHLINTNFPRDYKAIVSDIASATKGNICVNCGHPLNVSKGIEVGNIFQLGTRYSDALGVTYQDEQGVRQPVIMGSYGIGVGRLLACLAEEYHDEHGLKLPITTSPYQVHFVSLMKESDTTDAIYKQLTDEGIEVLYDDRKESAGVKFADADLIGLPIRITLGQRGFKEGTIELKLRSDLSTTHTIAIDSVVSEVKKHIKEQMDQLKG